MKERSYKSSNATLKNRGHDISLTENLRSMVDQEGERQMGMIDPGEIKMGGNKYLRYIWVATVPPCTEGVIWIINKRTGTVSKDQIKLLREAVHDMISVAWNSLVRDVIGGRYCPARKCIDI